MASYTIVQMNTRVKKEKHYMLEGAIEALHRKPPLWWDYFSDLNVDEIGRVTLSYEDRKLYKEENFYQFLAPFVENGSSITGWGEEVGDYWRVVFDGIGKYTLQKPVFIDEKIRRLMDAAPELLDACERLLVYKSIHPSHFDGVNDVMMDEVKKAVEKANGHIPR